MAGRGDLIPGTCTAPECLETQLQKGQRWLSSLEGSSGASQLSGNTHRDAQGVLQPQYSDEHSQRGAFEQALHAVQVAQSQLGTTLQAKEKALHVRIEAQAANERVMNAVKSQLGTTLQANENALQVRIDAQAANEKALHAVQVAQLQLGTTLQAKEKALQVRIEAQAANEQLFAADVAALDGRKVLAVSEEAIASGIAIQRKQVLNRREEALNTRDSGIAAREELATKREAAVYAREVALHGRDGVAAGREMSAEDKIQGWLQLDDLPHLSPPLSNHQLDQRMDDVIELIEFMDGVDSVSVSELQRSMSSPDLSKSPPRLGGVYINGGTRKQQRGSCHPFAGAHDALCAAMPDSSKKFKSSNSLRIGPGMQPMQPNEK